MDNRAMDNRAENNKVENSVDENGLKSNDNYTTMKESKMCRVNPEVLTEINPDPMDFLLYFSHHGKGYETTLDAYNSSTHVVEVYDKSIQDVGYRGPEVLANMAVTVMSIKKDWSKVKVIDIASGTGVIGKALYDRGFRDITAHDGAQAMLDFCKKLEVYTDTLCCPLDGLGSLPLSDDMYDLAAVSGSFIPDHLPLKGLEEVARIIKPGGFFINVNREGLLETEHGQQYEKTLVQLEEKGVWQKYGRLFFPRYNHHCNGIADIYEVC